MSYKEGVKRFKIAFGTKPLGSWSNLMLNKQFLELHALPIFTQDIFFFAKVHCCNNLIWWNRRCCSWNSQNEVVISFQVLSILDWFERIYCLMHCGQANIRLLVKIGMWEILAQKHSGAYSDVEQRISNSLYSTQIKLNAFLIFKDFGIVFNIDPIQNVNVHM